MFSVKYRWHSCGFHATGTYLGGATAVPPTPNGGPALTDDDDDGSALSSASSVDDDLPSPGTRAHVEQMYMEALAADDGVAPISQPA